MSWILFAILGYALAATTSLLDKYILKSRIPNPAVYAFFMGLFSAFALVLIPFLGRPSFFGWGVTAISFLSGALFIFGLVFLYKAVQKSEISRIAPLAGALIPAFALLLSLFGLGFDTQISLSFTGTGAFFLLVFGGFLLAFQFPFRKKMFIRGFPETLLAGFLIAAFFVLFKIAGAEQDFVSVFVWSRMGMLLGAWMLFLWRPFRVEIVENFRESRTHKQTRQTAGTIGYFILNKSLGGISYLAIGYAVFLGPVVIVQAMTSMQYALVTLFAFAAARFRPKLFEDVYDKGVWAQKLVALLLIAAGMLLAAISGGAEFF